MFAALDLLMAIKVIGEDEWIKGDYRGYATFDLEIEFFEEKLREKSVSYVEDGWGPAKAIMCKYGETQFYLMWLEYTEMKYKTTIEFLYPFNGAEKLLKDIVSELHVPKDNITWVNNEI